MQRKWWIPDSGNLKKFTISLIGDSWKDERLKLYKERSEQGARSRQEVEESVPVGVDPAQWRWYIGWRMCDLGKARSERGRKTRAQQEVAHTTRSRPMIVDYDEMVFILYCLVKNDSLEYLSFPAQTHAYILSSHVHNICISWHIIISHSNS